MMKILTWPLLGLFLMASPMEGVAEAPAAGEYTGIMKVTRRVGSMQFTHTLRAQATVSPEGNITILTVSNADPIAASSNSEDGVIRATYLPDPPMQLAFGPPPYPQGGYRINDKFIGTAEVNGTGFTFTYPWRVYEQFWNGEVTFIVSPSGVIPTQWGPAKVDVVGTFRKKPKR